MLQSLFMCRLTGRKVVKAVSLGLEGADGRKGIGVEKERQRTRVEQRNRHLPRKRVTRVRLVRFNTTA